VSEVVNEYKGDDSKVILAFDNSLSYPYEFIGNEDLYKYTDLLIGDSRFFSGVGGNNISLVASNNDDLYERVRGF
jgi:hypothetical protein